MAPAIGRLALDNGFHGSIPEYRVALPPQNIHLTDMQEHVLPYLQSFCSLEEKTPERVEGAVQLSAAGDKKLLERAASDKGALKQGSFLENEKIMEKKEKKSIHERLKINKEIIAKQQGKDSKEKGAELA